MNTSINKEEIVAKSVRFESDKLFVLLSNDTELEVDLRDYPILFNASEKERNNWRLIAKGHGIHWEDIDEDLSVQGFLASSKISVPNLK